MVTDAQMPSTIHARPRADGALTLCCALSPLELPFGDRLTLDDDIVTCGTPVITHRTEGMR